MEEQLKQLQTGFTLEFGSSEESVKNRIEQLKQYLELLGKVRAEINSLAQLHHKDVVLLIDVKESLIKETESLKTRQASEINAHNQKLEEKKAEHDKRLSDIQEAEEKKDQVDKVNSGLSTERRALEEHLTELRGNISASERRNREMQVQEKELTVSIASKKDEEAKLVVSIEADKKEFSRVSNEIAILEARK